MQSFITTLTVSTAAFAALTGAVPHARKHFHFHPARSDDIEPHIVERDAIAGPKPPTTYNLSPVGECGGSAGYGCAEGMCCSKWGYCGTGPAYCGHGGSKAGSQGAGKYKHPGGNRKPGHHKPPGGYPHHTGGGGWGTHPTVPPTTAAPTPTAPSSPGSTAPAYSAPAPSSGGGSGGFSGYKMYSGSGSASAGWPTTDEWMDFESAWTASVPNMKKSCAQWDVPNDSESEISELKSAVLNGASAYGMDERFILAIMMQESNGCVRVPTTDNGVTNPGLFQSHDGSGSCNGNNGVQNPCPASELKQMVKDGVDGTTAGDGLKQCFTQCPGSGAQAYYQAAVIYNSGSFFKNLGDNSATPCYASDVANRLMGWTEGLSGCTLT